MTASLVNNIRFRMRPAKRQKRVKEVAPVDSFSKLLAVKEFAVKMLVNKLKELAV